MSETMTWEQQFAAAGAIGDEIALRMRKPGDWYVDHRGVHVKEGAMLVGSYGNGATPEEAVRDHWRALTELKPGSYLVVSAGREARRHAYRWNGYMWSTVHENLTPSRA